MSTSAISQYSAAIKALLERAWQASFSAQGIRDRRRSSVSNAYSTGKAARPIDFGSSETHAQFCSSVVPAVPSVEVHMSEKVKTKEEIMWDLIKILFEKDGMVVIDEDNLVTVRDNDCYLFYEEGYEAD